MTDQKPDFSELKALYVNCTLKQSPHESHTRTLINVSMNIMKKEEVEAECIRLVDYNVAYGVNPDMTEHGAEKDEWPELWKKVDAADILVIGTPIWLGEKSSVASKLIERMYAMSALQNEKGQFIYYGKAGGCLVTGNEDGIKHCAMGILYALQHIGYTVPPQADAGWIGEAGPGPSYGDESEDGRTGFDNEFTNRNTTFMTYNLLNLAKMLKDQNGFPNYGNSQQDWDDGTRWNFENPE